jgi:hypothetical protein
MDREVTRHLLAEIDELHERVAHLEKGLGLEIFSKLKHAVAGREKGLSQYGLLGMLRHFDPEAVATGATTVEFTLHAKRYTVTLNEGRTAATVRSPDGQQSGFAALDPLEAWLKAQKGVLAARAPEGSRLLLYTQAVLAQQGARARHPC